MPLHKLIPNFFVVGFDLTTAQVGLHGSIGFGESGSVCFVHSLGRSRVWTEEPNRLRIDHGGLPSFAITPLQLHHKALCLSASCTPKQSCKVNRGASLSTSEDGCPHAVNLVQISPILANTDFD